MKKIKIKSSDDFGSLNTKYAPDAPQVSDSEFTAGTKNIETSVKGVITKRKGGVQYSTIPTSPRDQYEAIFSDGVRHLLTVDNGTLRYSSGDGNETSVLSGLSAGLNFEFANTQDRVYFGNGIQKKVYDRSTNYGGVTYAFPTQTVKDIGATAPTTAPTVSVVAGGSIPVGNHTYKVTFVYYDSEESNGGLASAVANVTGGNQTVNLTAIPVGGYGVTVRKIYRDNNDGVYTLVGVLSNNTATTFSDTSSAGLTPIPDDQGNPPDFTLISLYLDRLFLAGIPGDPYYLYFSEVSMPDIYPSSNTIPCNQEDPITGIIKYLDRLVVFNRRSMGQIVGKTSDQFRYAEIEPSVGCVDNRSIQIRVIDGVPVLVWLSDKGFYAYNGNSVVYISNSIEDQINSNIQQAVIQKNKITNSDYTTFSNGTLSNGVNIEANPGTITNKGPYWDTALHPLASYDDQTNPKHIFDETSEFVAGTVTTNVTVFDPAAVLKPVPYKVLAFSSGTLDGTTTVPTGLQITEIPVLSSETSSGSGTFTATAQKRANKFVAQVSGYVTNVYINTGAFGTVTFSVWSHDSVNDRPLAQIGVIPSPFVVAGTTYWIVASFSQQTATAELGNNFASVTSGARSALNSNGFWFNGAGTYEGSYQIRGYNGPISGSWTSEVYDTLSTGTCPTTLDVTGTYPAATTTQVYIEGSADSFATIGVSNVFTNPSGGILSIPVNDFRYWRVRIQMTSTDSGQYALVAGTLSPTSLYLEYPSVGTWVSEVIDTTSDSTVYSNLSAITTSPGVVPFVSSAILTISTSSDNITYSPFVTLGSHSVQRYVKIKAVLTKGKFGGPSSPSTAIPTMSTIDFRWTVVSTFISDDIDLGIDPSGFDIFQASFTLNGGSVVFSMRSAATSGALGAATWYTVTNGEFPTSSLPTLQWVQWRAVITSNPDQVPTIDSVTIGWFVGTDIQSIRCASIFYNKNYYVALAEFESDHNNLLYVLDYEGKWRLFRDINVATMSFFFNNPYYGDAVQGKIIRFLEGLSDQGTPIELQVNTKAYNGSTEYSDYEGKVKVLDNMILSVKNTGATYDVSYSVDDGTTFYPMYDTNGNNSWVTGTDGRELLKYLRPSYVNSIPTGYTVLFKIHNNDMKECEIKNWKAEMFVREQPPIITG